MSLTWKDAIATIMVGIAGVLTFAMLKGFDWPLLTNWRTGTLLLMAIGLGTCVFVNSDSLPTKNTWTDAAGALGILAIILSFAGLVSNSKVLFVALAIDIAALWVLGTLHHIFTPAHQSALERPVPVPVNHTHRPILR